MSKLSLCIALVTLLAGSVRAQRTDEIGIIFLPFKNNSDFQGKWDIGNDVPRFVSAYTTARFGVKTVSPVIVLDFLHQQNLSDEKLDDIGFWKELYQRFGLRFAVAGSVETFDISRFVTGDPQLMGYEAFKGETKISYRVLDLKRSGFTSDALEVTKGEASGEFSDRSLVLTLLGKPTQRTVEYRDLDKIPFGTEDFNRTVIGQACLQMSEHFSLKLEIQLPILKSKNTGRIDTVKLTREFSDTTALNFKAHFVMGLIVFVESDEAFINLGTGDGVQKGMTAIVFSQKDPTKKVGEIEILDVRSDHFSLGKIVGGKGVLQVKDPVGVRVVD